MHVFGKLLFNRLLGHVIEADWRVADSQWVLNRWVWNPQASLGQEGPAASFNVDPVGDRFMAGAAGIPDTGRHSGTHLPSTSALYVLKSTIENRIEVGTDQIPWRSWRDGNRDAKTD
jgi:hypothetical protein